jgi:hypothetical protein
MDNDYKQNIIAAVKSYDIPEDQRSALFSMIFGYLEGRVEAGRFNEAATKFLVDAATCRATGLDDLETRVANVLMHFRRFNKEHSCLLRSRSGTLSKTGAANSRRKLSRSF